MRNAVMKAMCVLPSLVILGCSSGIGSTSSGASSASNGEKAQTDNAFVNFETPHVRPLILGPDGKQLFAVNTPDNRLTIYSVTASGLALATEVPVGLEPVSVAVRQNKAGHSEAWVVNHLSDSVSIVDIDPNNLGLSRVTRTLQVGDEPRDIVFAGKSHDRAFITAAHRGQNRPGDPQLTTQGIGRADVWTFDTNNLGAALGGTPLSIVQLFGDTPRALAVSPDGGTVYAAVFFSGSRTTTIPSTIVKQNGGLPPPPDGSTANAPTTGLIVKFVNGKWVDETGKDWSTFVPFALPDRDVFMIDANASPPASLSTLAGSNSPLPLPIPTGGGGAGLPLSQLQQGFAGLAAGSGGAAAAGGGLPLPAKSDNTTKAAALPIPQPGGVGGGAPAFLAALPTEVGGGGAAALPTSFFTGLGLPTGAGGGGGGAGPAALVALFNLFNGSVPNLPVSVPGIPNPAANTTDSGSFASVGTVLFNMAVRPDNGALYVSNTEAKNEVRFAPMMTGKFAENRITVIKDGNVKPVHLNPHINYAAPTGPQSEIDQSLSSPTDMVFSADGHTVYVAGFSSAKVGAYDTDKLEAGEIQKTLIPVGDGPSGLALDSANNRLYVMNRLDQSISIVSLSQNQETQRIALPYDPTPAKVREGRQFLYDARISSGHGDLSCHTCHVFGDNDGIAWDLGDPFGKVTDNLLPAANVIPTPFHPMKGAMTTQSLRGLAGAGSMHWRGDKNGTFNSDGTPNTVPNAWHNEDLSFKQFNGAFTDLQGRSARLTDDQMQKYTNFALTLRYPPNPIQALDNTDTADQAAGRDLFMNDKTAFASAFACNDCHELPITTSGKVGLAGYDLTRSFKIPHFRNLYEKVGMFGVPIGMLISTTSTVTTATPEYYGNQVRGFGYSHDGGISTIDTFLKNFTFEPFPVPGAPIPDLTAPGVDPTTRTELGQFLLAMDTGLRPIVGQQVTVNTANGGDAQINDRLSLLIARADAGDCDLVVKGVRDGHWRGSEYVGKGSFKTDRSGEMPLDKAALMNAAKTMGQEQTFTCVPPGNGLRIGIDRNLDGHLDGDG